MHPDIKRDIDQKVRDGLLSTKDSRLLLKYLAERQIIRGLGPSFLLSEYRCLIPWAELLKFQEATIAIFTRQKRGRSPIGLLELRG
jgi:hypothetical protein